METSTETQRRAGRRENRVFAMQAIYAQSISCAANFEAFLEEVIVQLNLPSKALTFGKELALGTDSHLREIDETIRQHLQNWSFDRLARVDLSILRLAIYEMLYRDDIPYIVSINEAIELSKQFSTPDSKRFINGVLDQLKRGLETDAHRVAAKAPSKV